MKVYGVYRTRSIDTFNRICICIDFQANIVHSKHVFVMYVPCCTRSRLMNTICYFTQLDCFG